MDLSGVDLHFEAQDYVMTPYADLRTHEEIDSDFFFFWPCHTVVRILVS